MTSVSSCIFFEDYISKSYFSLNLQNKKRHVWAHFTKKGHGGEDRELSGANKENVYRYNEKQPTFRKLQ